MTMSPFASMRSFAALSGGMALAALVASGPAAWAQTNPSAPANAGSATEGQSLSGFATGPSQEISEPGIGALYSSPFSTDHLFGNWGGSRKWLEDHGFEVDLDYLTENAGNITGGQREGFRTSGQIGLQVDLDLQKLLGVAGNAFHTMTVNREGRNVATDTIGDDLETPQEIYGGGGNVIAHLVYAYDEQSLFGGRLDLAGGWLPVGTYFAASPLYCDFMNVLFCGNPHPLPNYPGEDDWPQATLGGQGRVLLTPQVYLQAGVFSVDPDFGTGGGGISGWAWADPHKSGVSVPAEVGWVPSFGRNHLIGHYKAGFDHDTHHYAELLVPAGEVAPGNTRDMEYVLLDQMVLRQAPGDTSGVILFGGWVHGSDDVSPLTQHAFAGVTTTGSAWGRAGDTLGVSFNWVEVSGDLTHAEEIALEGGSTLPLNIGGLGAAFGVQNTEQVVEVAYTAAVYRGVTIMPDFQYIVRPGGTTATPDAAVLGFRTNINF